MAAPAAAVACNRMPRFKAEQGGGDLLSYRACKQSLKAFKEAV